jgi:hypothetical protein
MKIAFLNNLLFIPSPHPSPTQGRGGYVDSLFLLGQGKKIDSLSPPGERVRVRGH